MSDLQKILADNFTTDEIIEALDLSPRELVNYLEDAIEENEDSLWQKIEEDLGYERD